MDNLVKAIGKNRVALIVLAGGTVIIAILLADRVTDTVGGAVETVEQAVRDVVSRVLSSGFIAALILIGATLLGAPIAIAVGAAGLFLATGAVGRALSAIGNGDGAIHVICESHGGIQSELQAGNSVIVACRDGTTYQLNSGG
jgi:hypothetical protein